MRGSVVKKNDRWYVVIEDRDPATGARKRRWHSGYRTKREAQAACNELVVAMQRGDYLQANRQTVGEFALEWLATSAPTVRPSTLDKYQRDLRAHVIRRIGFVPLAKLDGPALNRLWAQLAVTGRKPASPGGLASKRSATHRPIKAWTADTLRRFLEATRDHELSALWMLIATTGLRRGEALGLRWSDVDLDTGRAQINQTVIAIGWTVHLGQPKTQAGRRPIALDPSTILVLREHQLAMQARPATSAGRGGDQLVFSEPDGAPLHPERVYQAFRRAVIRHHLPSIPLHGLRHTWATLALQMDVHPRVVQERLGHSNIAITLQTYSHVLPIMHDDAAATVAALFMPSRPRS